MDLEEIARAFEQWRRDRRLAIDDIWLEGEALLLRWLQQHVAAHATAEVLECDYVGEYHKRLTIDAPLPRAYYEAAGDSTVEAVLNELRNWPGRTQDRLLVLRIIHEEMLSDEDRERVDTAIGSETHDPAGAWETAIRALPSWHNTHRKKLLTSGATRAGRVVIASVVRSLHKLLLPIFPARGRSTRASDDNPPPASYPPTLIEFIRLSIVCRWPYDHGDITTATILGSINRLSA